MKAPALVLLALALATIGVTAADPEPSYKDVDAKTAAELVAKDADKKITVLDVRTPAEFAESHLEGAKNVDFLGEDFAEKLAELERDKTYLVHCASGRRSAQALEKMRELGFESVIQLEGGMAAWKEAGNPVVEPE